MPSSPASRRRRCAIRCGRWRLTQRMRRGEFGDTERPEGWKDYQHMNGEYGALVLRALFATPGF